MSKTKDIANLLKMGEITETQAQDLLAMISADPELDLVRASPNRR